LHSVTDFCSEILEATKEMKTLKESLAKLLPWAAKGGEIVGEITPLAKVLVKLVNEVVKEKDPETLGIQQRHISGRNHTIIIAHFQVSSVTQRCHNAENRRVH
jgi:hypothetical protein